MSELNCCGKRFTNKFSLRRHTNSHHRTASPVFRCFVEGCLQRFRSSGALRLHQREHLYTSNIFYVNSQAFNKTTFVLRKDLHEDGLQDFDFIFSPEAIEEVKRIINCEIVKKNALIFSIAVSINFVKYGLDGEINGRATPCFFYLNHVM